jgi:hypothetical protein
MDNVNVDSSTFLDPTSDDDAILRAVARMTGDRVPAGLWAHVANDPAYRPFHRAVAVYELFQRHVATPATLEQIARLLDGGGWLRNAALEKIESMGGEAPVLVPAGGAAFVIRLPHDPTAARPEIGVYLALDRDLDATSLRDALMSKPTDPSAGQIRIVDFSLFPESLATTNSR